MNRYKRNNISLKVLLITFAAILTLSFSNSYASKLANYLGTGSNPHLQLILSKNAPNWKSYTIDYQGVGNVPYPDWSTWDVKDTTGNYYGTITLKCASAIAPVVWDTYKAGTDGYYLDGIKLSYNATIKAYQLTADKVITPNGVGPFPNAPLAKPATYSDGTPIVLSVNGNKIVNDKGKTILLKGFARPSLEWNPQGQHLSPEDITNMANWVKGGINVIRIDMNQNYWVESGPVTEKGSYKQIINAIVYYAVQNNMAVILDLHWVQDGGQSPMANKKSLDFWTDVAKDYQDFGTVLFELYNEPEGIDKSVWLYGDSQYAGYQQLYNVIRSTGADNIVIINGLDYGYNLSFVNKDFRVQGGNIVYGSHPYNEKGADDWTGPGGSFANNFKGIINDYPLIFTELGVNQSSYFPNGYKEVYNRILSYAEDHGISYTGFAWWVDGNSDKWNTFPDLIKDWSGTPLNGGVLVQQDIQQNPGTPLNSN